MKWRFALLQLGFLGAALLICLRLGYWQIVKASDLKTQAELQRTSSQLVVAPRGEIKGADGFPLATNEERFLLFANPHLTTNVSGKKLADLADALEASDSSKILAALTMPDRVWVPVASNLDRATREKIEALEMTGLGFETQLDRFYPESSASGHLLGFVGKDENGKQQGYFGLEGFYDKQLSGVDGRVIQETDALNRPIVMGAQNYVPPQEGRTLFTSIDRTLQFIVNQKLTSALERYGAISGSVTIMEPKTGNILAMVSSPGYNPENYHEFDSSLYRNPIVAESYEPGSTFKVLVMAAGIDTKVIKPNTKCTICSSPLQVSNYTVRTWDDKYHPDSTMTEVLQHSDNVGMVFVSRKLGKDKLLDYIDKFGFGHLTGVDLQDEATPALRNEKDWYEIDLATAAFGQGIAVTPLQMVKAVAAIANKGKMPTPKVVTKIASNSVTKDTPTKPGVQVISGETAAQITEMMVNSVEKGEAKWAKPQGYVIAGKTGTAQIPVEGHYDKTKTIASFVGFAPAYDPKFVMLVTLREPQTSQWGSETAAPLWFEIAKEILRFYQIPPSR